MAFCVGSMLIASFTGSRRSRVTSALLLWHVTFVFWGWQRERIQSNNISRMSAVPKAAGRQNSGIPPHGWLCRSVGRNI